MKIYPKVYEDVFSNRRTLTKCKPRKLGNDMDWSTQQYTRLMRKHFHKYEATWFKELVKVIWLTRRFCYYGYPRLNNRGNGPTLDRAFSVFMRSRVGWHFATATQKIPSVVASYFEDFFPGFDAKDMLKEKIKYPYFYMGIGHLICVHQMAERMELLAYGEKKKMNFAKFADFIINQVNCFHDELGKEIYNFCYGDAHNIYGMFYVRKNRKT